MNPVFDCIVLGAGPAGLSAASWLHELGCRVLVLDKNPKMLSSFRDFEFPQNWVLGWHGMGLNTFAKHVEEHLSPNVKNQILLNCPVHRLTRTNEACWFVETAKQNYQAKSILIASGRNPRMPWQLGVDVAFELQSKVMSAYDLTLNRAQLRDSRVLLLGAGDNAAENAYELLSNGNQVTVWSRGDWRARPELVTRLLMHPCTNALEVMLNQPLPERLQVGEKRQWRIDQTVFPNKNSAQKNWISTNSSEFDHVVSLLGFESLSSLKSLLPEFCASVIENDPKSTQGLLSRASCAALENNGLYFCGDVRQYGHPSIQTAMSDGVNVAVRFFEQLKAVNTLSIAAVSPDAPSLKNNAFTTYKAENLPIANMSSPRILRLNHLRIQAPIGVLSHEKNAPQTIQVDVELNLGTQDTLPCADDIAHVLDYRKVRQAIIDECTAQHVHLLESLVGQVANHLMTMPTVQGVRLTIAKLHIFDDCEVAISTELGQWPNA